MSRPASGYDQEVMNTNVPAKYAGLNEFMSSQPPEVDGDVVAMAFHVIDTDCNVSANGD